MRPRPPTGVAGVLLQPQERVPWLTEGGKGKVGVGLCNVARMQLVLLAVLISGGAAAVAGAATLPDSRGWEMISPVAKNGGQIDPPGALAGGGLLQAAADGQSGTYGSSASFADGAQGAPPPSQSLSRRSAAGWATQNITVPLFSGSYGLDGEGVPYRIFSGDLARGLLLNGRHCRGEGGGCG